MKVKVDSFLSATVLGGASSKNPVEAEIVSVKFIEKDDLPFKSEEGRYELVVRFNDDEYSWTANKTSLKAIVAAYSDESDNWAGKTVHLYSVEQNVSGQIKQVVYGKVS